MYGSKGGGVDTHHNQLPISSVTMYSYHKVNSNLLSLISVLMDVV